LDADKAEKPGEIIPVEIKSSSAPRGLSGLHSFLKDHSVKTAFCVCTTPRAYLDHDIHFIPWQDFIARLYMKNLF
jgi:hypothetical protein